MPLDTRDRGSCGENARWPSDPCGQPCGECSGRDRAFRLDCRVDSPLLSGEAHSRRLWCWHQATVSAAFARPAKLLASALG